MRDLRRGIVAHQLQALGRASALRYVVEVDSESWGWCSLHIALKFGKLSRTTRFSRNLEEVCSI